MQSVYKDHISVVVLVGMLRHAWLSIEIYMHVNFVFALFPDARALCQATTSLKSLALIVNSATTPQALALLLCHKKLEDLFINLSSIKVSHIVICKHTKCTLFIAAIADENGVKVLSNWLNSRCHHGGTCIFSGLYNYCNAHDQDPYMWKIILSWWVHLFIHNLRHPLKLIS